eukprot:CAMPEP_0175917108 /NCGR_PEP_ID=MMETSP0108-20121206/11193_1 /TAXON_ID=195067 ORGANISM="Goniomonas pacifica, Strain CCMP1869" /NCGR_SAMPLE_ID=MMETSP0108 /ASSEMBLY_ACC=CAM_ASM_000204 /LENGTH=166 /DNA_ID=CAMNT_0017239683 /DNA_START=519 /DNA_END=1019 /DNA_ORIENTATION=+
MAKKFDVRLKQHGLSSRSQLVLHCREEVSHPHDLELIPKVLPPKKLQKPFSDRVPFGVGRESGATVTPRLVGPQVRRLRQLTASVEYPSHLCVHPPGMPRETTQTLCRNEGSPLLQEKPELENRLFHETASSQYLIRTMMRSIRRKTRCPKEQLNNALGFVNWNMM